MAPTLFRKFETRITKYAVASDEGDSKFQRSALAAAECEWWGKVWSGSSSPWRWTFLRPTEYDWNKQHVDLFNLNTNLKCSFTTFFGHIHFLIKRQNTLYKQLTINMHKVSSVQQCPKALIIIAKQTILLFGPRQFLLLRFNYTYCLNLILFSNVYPAHPSG